jgi:predicted nucleic acid-binding protein
MYIVGADHPNRVVAQTALQRLFTARTRLVTDAEVLQEVLRRYRAIGRVDAIQPAFDVLLGIVDVVFPIEARDVEQARDLMLARPRLSARDALHVAIMHRYRINTILSFDRGFDGTPDVARIENPL